MGNRARKPNSYPFMDLPEAQGLYNPAYEHDACGLGFVASIEGHKSHDIVLKGIQILINLTHRGACGCDPQTGDGAGVLIQIPHAFFDRECSKLGFTLPSPGEYGVGMVFLPVDPQERTLCEGVLEHVRAFARADRARLARHSFEWRHDWPPGAGLAALHRADFCSLRAATWSRTRSSASCTWCARKPSI